MRRLLILGITLLASSAAPASAQPPSEPDLLARVPKDFGMCLVIHDLRGHTARLEQAPCIQALRQSPLGQALAAAPELQNFDLAKIERDLKQHLGLDWPALRDDLLGDAAVFAYRPAGPDGGEQGLFMTKARRPALLKQVIDRLNEIQQKAGELKSLEARDHQGTKYFRREHVKNTLWYALQGAVFAIASSEEVLKRVLDSSQAAAPVRAALRRAGAESSLAALWVNPRAFDAELAAKSLPTAGPDALILKALVEHWQALDGVVVALSVKDDIEARFTLLARPESLSSAAKAWFSHRGSASVLWQRLPADSIFIAAGQTDFGAMADGLLELAPPEIRKVLVDAVSKNVGAALGLDPFRDVLPNLGPDFGVCILPAIIGKQFPQALVAVAVKPGEKDVAVDQALFRSVQFFAGLAIFDHNRTQPEGKRIRIRTTQLAGVEVKYLDQEQFFPAGLQPAAALKDGFLVFATSPAALEKFQKSANSTPESGNEVPLVRLAPEQLAQLLRLHRDRVVEALSQKMGSNQVDGAAALDNLLGVLDLCRSVTLSRQSGEGQLTLGLRFRMSNGTK